MDGPVVTSDATGSRTDALAVRAGRVVALGERAVRPLITRRTEVVRLSGRLLLPGFQDAHAHPVFGGLRRLRCDLTEAATAADCLRLVAAHGGAGWVLGGGWDSPPVSYTHLTLPTNREV